MKTVRNAHYSLGRDNDICNNSFNVELLGDASNTTCKPIDNSVMCCCFEQNSVDACMRDTVVCVCVSFSRSLCRVLLFVVVQKLEEETARAVSLEARLVRMQEELDRERTQV